MIKIKTYLNIHDLQHVHYQKFCLHESVEGISILNSQSSKLISSSIFIKNDLLVIFHFKK